MAPWTPEKKKLMVAGALGVLSLALSWAYLNLREDELLQKGQPLKIWSASHTLPAFARLTKRDLVQVEIPRAYVPLAAVTKIEEILGKRSLVPFGQGEPVLFNKVGEEGVTLASAVPEGFRAVSLGVDEVSGLAGLVEPGDRVDLYSVQSDKEIQAGVLLQQVQVLAVGNRTSRDKENEAGKAPATVTLAVPESEAALVLLAAARSALHLVLRAPGDERPLTQSRALPADLQRRLAQARGTNAPSAPAASGDFIPSKR